MPDIKISEAAPAAPLMETDLLPIARAGSDVPYNASLQDIADYITVLASTHPPAMSNMPETAGTMTQYARGDHIHPTDVSRAPLDSPELTGRPCSVTPALTENSDMIATTEFVTGLLALQPKYAPLDSPQFTGTPRAPTPGIDDNTDIIATTQYFMNQAGTDAPTINGAALAGVSHRWSREDHVHPTDQSRASVASVPAGSVTLPHMDGTPGAGIGTTWARADHIHPTDTTLYPASNPAGFQTAAQVTVTLQAYAYRDSPVFLGNPQAPQPLLTDSSATLATTAFVRTGTKTADTPPSGQIGEYIVAQVLQSAPISIATGQTVNITQLNLSAGDWGVSGNVGFAFTGGGATILTCGINTVSAQIPTSGTSINMLQLSGNVSIPATKMPIPASRILLAAPATIYLVASSTFTGTGITYGTVHARRVR